MPTYCFTCDSCSSKQEAFLPMSASGTPLGCEKCGGEMRRDWAAEGCVIDYDPEMTSYDLQRYMQLKREGREVERPVLSQCLGRVPGLKRFVDERGIPYAVFRNKAERKRELKRMGLAEI